MPLFILFVGDELMIVTEALCKTFWDRKQGEIRAVLPTNFQVGKGEVFGLLGPNGAGKTTLLRMLSTVLKPTSGKGQINGFDVLSQQDLVKKSIGFLSGNTKLYGRLTPKEILIYFGRLYDMNKQEISMQLEKVVELLDMGKFVNQPIEKLSTGQTQRTSIARCLFHDPALYILDEPTLGLDILSSRTILDFIKKEALKGKTVIFSTHYMEEAELLCSTIGLMYQGKIMDINTLEGYQKKFSLTHLSDIFMQYVN